MMNNKETLIKTLRGSVAQLNELSDMTEGIDVYDAAGYVDTEFLMEALSVLILSWMRVIWLLRKYLRC